MLQTTAKSNADNLDISQGLFNGSSPQGYEETCKASDYEWRKYEYMFFNHVFLYNDDTIVNPLL